MFDINSKEIEIFSSRDQIRNQLISLAKSYIELENVDLVNTSFLSYVINVLSVLAANQMYYTGSIYREFFLTEAQMDESVYNLAKWIGYIPKTALPATCDIMLSFPLTFSDNIVNFKIPDDFKVWADNVPYSIAAPIIVKANMSMIEQEYQNMQSEGITIEVLGNKAITVRDPSGMFYPVQINSLEKTASVILPFVQYETVEYTYQVPDNLDYYQFWSIPLTFNGMIWKLEVKEITQNGSIINIPQSETNSLYTMTPEDYKYVWSQSPGKAEIFFGNGVFGKQPTKGSTISITLYLTLGESGRVITGTLIKPDRLYYTTSTAKNILIQLMTTNPSPSEGGVDTPSIYEIKTRAIANLTSKQRFVSEQDYNDISLILPNSPLKMLSRF